MGNKTEKLVKTIFAVDNVFVRACERILDLVVLNLLFLLTCLPVLTIGIAKMSLYQVLFDLKRQKRLPVIASYLQALKRHAKQGFKLGLMELVLVGFCLLDLVLAHHHPLSGARLIQVMAIAMLILATGIFLYVYPMATRFEMSIKALFKTGFLFAGLHFPWTFLMLGIIIFLMTLLYTTSLTFLLGLSLLVVIGFSCLGYGQIIVMERIFQKYPLEGKN
ncbi:DUF624 domain-containing protein [Streptococcus merionis]|uniref:Membrane protein n=1 Tax=Streptococcus merionis TaxID=400065 RepID=A0A239SVM3_9STRE|nr:DUF624 domain-containing protein [Streptococcus merionis]SNU89555.1 membrane protein [Streptococcus merionis]